MSVCGLGGEGGIGGQLQPAPHQEKKKKERKKERKKKMCNSISIGTKQVPFLFRTGPPQVAAT